GLALADLSLYDLKVVDVNGDKKPDVIVMYESGSSTNAAEVAAAPVFVSRNGSVHVFLNRGLAKTGTQAGKNAK
ncbi:MAG: hypothetical protein QOI58_1021, partial [Thermoanaerobaculia bacterium]|nr:hypothetical protein [Thermoanaerobaculia bacterium]